MSQVQIQEASEEGQEVELSLKQQLFNQQIAPLIHELHQACTDNGFPCIINAIIADRPGDKGASFSVSASGFDERVVKAYPTFLIAQSFLHQPTADQIGLGDYAIEAFGHTFTRKDGQISTSLQDKTEIAVTTEESPSGQ